jgi:hypothetical protein
MIVQPNKINHNTVPNYNQTSYSYLTQTTPHTSFTIELNNNQLLYNNKQSHDQNNNHNITPSHINDDVPLINDDVTRQHENVHSTSHSSSTHTTSITKNLNNYHNYNQFIKQITITSQNSNNNHVTYSKRAPIKKIKNPYKGNHYNQQNRPIENIIDEDTIKALNYNIYNINTDYIKIGTINIQKGFQYKKEDLINFCIERSYHLLALTEIGKINNPTSKPHLTISSQKNTNTDIIQTYHTYTYNSSDNVNQGMGIIINGHIAKHLIKIEGYENRILILTLCFRKNINIKIIIVYLPANSKHHNDTEKCNLIIKNQINTAIRQNHQIILLGDFNIDVKNIKDNKTTGDKNWKLKKELITYINSQHLIDNIKSFHDNPPITWTSQSHENITKRLDYIYTTQEILDHTFYGFVEAINDTYFTTDHNLVAILLNKEYFLKYRQNCKYSNFSQNREIIVYKNISDNFKKLFKDRLSTINTKQKSYVYTNNTTNYKLQTI